MALIRSCFEMDDYYVLKVDINRGGVVIGDINP